MSETKLITPKEVAQILGFTAPTIIKWGKIGEIAGFQKKGRRYFIDEEMLHKDLKRRVQENLDRMNKK